MGYPYNPKHYVVEIHCDKDVFYHPFAEENGALRCVDRNIPKLNSTGPITEIRVWHDRSLLSKYEAKQ